MSKYIKNILLGGLILTVFGACSKEEPENFDSYEEAYYAAQGTSEIGLMLVDELLVARDISLEFDGTLPDFELSKTTSPAGQRLRKVRSSQMFAYDPLTGFFSWDTTVTTEGTLHAHGSLRFTPRGIGGLPIETTDQLEYAQNITGDFAEEFEGSSLELHLKIAASLFASGIAGYRDSTGNLTISGDNDLSYKMKFSEPEYGSYTFEYVLKSTATAVSFGVEDTYPNGGSVAFTMKLNVKGSDVDEGFFIEGMITFDGTTIAVMEFGGYTFHVDLTTGEITDVLNPVKAGDARRMLLRELRQ